MRGSLSTWIVWKQNLHVPTGVLEEAVAKIGTPLKVWFLLGSAAGVVSQVFVMLYVPYILISSFQPSGQQLVTTVVPGINVPIQHLPWFLLAFLMSSIIHELGHAMAALCYNVTVRSYGVSMVMMVPTFYTMLCSDSLRRISPMRRLQVLTAGLWHNLTTTVVVALLSTQVDWLFHPLYAKGDGTTVMYMNKRSLLQNQVSPYDRLLSVNNCSVLSVEDWRRCVLTSAASPPRYCVSHSQTRMDPSGGGSCCNTLTGSDMCFSIVGMDMASYFCAAARQIILQSQRCRDVQDCSAGRQVCVELNLPNNTRAHVIQIAGKDPVVFIGHPRDLSASVRLSEFHPKYAVLPLFGIDYVLILLGYISSMSAALGLLNMLPCCGLDGEATFCTLLDMAMPFASLSARRAEACQRVVQRVYSVLLAMLMSVSVYQFVRSCLL